MRKRLQRRAGGRRGRRRPMQRGPPAFAPSLSCTSAASDCRQSTEAALLTCSCHALLLGTRTATACEGASGEQILQSPARFRLQLCCRHCRCHRHPLICRASLQAQLPSQPTTPAYPAAAGRSAAQCYRSRRQRRLWEAL